MAVNRFYLKKHKNTHADKEQTKPSLEPHLSKEEANYSDLKIRILKKTKSLNFDT